jgi:hypothetical protein
MPRVTAGGHRSGALPIIILAVAIAAPLVARSAPTGATVEGRVRLPEGGIKEPDVQYVGYIDRIPNPITELRPYDPRPECFVFLEGGPAAPEASRPDGKTVQWTVNSGFATPILPVVVGTKIEIKNVSRSITHALYAVDKPDVFSAEPLGPGGSRDVTAAEPGKALVIRSKDSPHVEARIVALPTRYFAPLRRDGSFSIPDVPAGKWTVMVWYRDGWLPVQKVIDVGSKTEKVELRLPDKLEPEGAKP